MTGAGGRRRSLLANAIESIGTTPAPGADGLTDEPAPSENVRLAEEPASSSFLERRGIAFDEIARTVKRLTIRIKPSECSIWPGNARDYAALSYDRCSSLIESIREEGTNREPVVVRRTPQADHPYELIVGTRRHFSVSWLHANNHTEIELVARIETLDDEGAFRLADLENREREDVTDLERARNYRHAIDAYYNGVRAQMADRLAIPKQNLHNLLQLAELPDEVVAAFAQPADLKVRHGMRLSPLVKDDRHRDAIIARALEIAAEQATLKDAGREKIDGSRVCEQLAGAALPTKARPNAKSVPSVTTSSGREIGQVLSDTRAKGITININPRGEASVDEILEALRPVIEKAKCTHG
jgi:ParB family chromosome partitioning protein